MAMATDLSEGIEVDDASVNDAFLLDAYRRMALIRTLETRVLELSQSKPPIVVGSTHLCAGHEAVPVGAIGALTPEDQIVTTYRGHGWALASGLSPDEVLGEICHRAIGVNNGRAGSAMIMAPHRGFIGENSIIGAGAPIACGVAMANQAAGNNRVVVVSFGDGTMNQGATNEAFAFAVARKLPVVFICENNGWSEMTPIGDMVPVKRLAQRLGGFGMLAATIDGCDPLIVRDSIALAVARARSGEGPAFVECTVPRLWGHYNGDIEHYRPREDREHAQTRDPLQVLRRRLLDDAIASPEICDQIDAEVEAQMSDVIDRVLRSDLYPVAKASAEIIAPPMQPGLGTEGTSEPVQMTYVQAVNASLDRALEIRDDVVVYGEDVGRAGGIFGASRNLQKKYGAERVFDTPISESAILGSAVGAAMTGLRPVVEIMWADFLLVALDQLVNQAANVRYITGGLTSVPMVVRTQQGSTPGSCAQHSQSLEALLAHIPGLKVALPATPQDAYDVLQTAIADPDPCVVIESRSLYQIKGDVVVGAALQPAGVAKIRRAGYDVLIVTWGTMLQPALDAAELMADDGIEATVLDLRWLAPLDEATLTAAAKACAWRVVVVHEANLTAGFGAEIVARLHGAHGEEISSDGARLAVQRVAAPNIRIPAAPHLRDALIPGVDEIVAAVRRVACVEAKA